MMLISNVKRPLKPVLKYIGGKSREISHLISYLPNDFNRYIEPFFGGGALYFYLQPHKAILNDINKPLMSFYQQLINQYPLMRQQLNELQNMYELNQLLYKNMKEKHKEERILNLNEPFYYHMRNLFNCPDNTYLKGVIYFFLNKTAYSGIIRYNNKGEYNVPFGRYSNFNTQSVTKQHSDLLTYADIFAVDYKRIFDMVKIDDFMFLDPPYDDAYNDYGNFNMKNGFDRVEHLRLAEDFKNLSCKTLMVIGKTSLTEDLYKNYICEEYSYKYSVNIRNRFESEKMHMLVKNY